LNSFAFLGRTLAFGLFLFLCSCETGYYLHLARGQARVVLNCEPIEELLASSSLDSARRANLSLVQAIRRFGFEQIGLHKSSSYTRFFDTGGKPISWNVSASPPDRFEPYLWRFPIAGTVPYKGFFDRERARKERDRLQGEGYDVLLRPVSAYSTLGYFSDPVLSSMLEYSVDSLADLILHELTHATVYAKGQTEFNESLATFVGQTGSLEFLAHYYGPESPQIPRAQKRRRDAARFGEFMMGVVAELDSLYQRELSPDTVLVQRREIFTRSQARFRSSLRPQFELASYDGFLEWEVNNARLLSYRRYHRSLDAFAAVYQMQGDRLDLAMEVFQACGETPSPWSCLEKAIAPDD